MTGKELKRLRSKKGMTQESFADWLGISKRSLENWEQGRRGVSPLAELVLKRALEEKEL